MGDHFVLLMDRLITDSTLAAAIESRNMSQIPAVAGKSQIHSTQQWSFDRGSSRSMVPKLVECRICQDEDQDYNMESPCACCGSLKSTLRLQYSYAHRKCIQTWCNEKGDTICEICHQQFEPNYTSPPQMLHYGGIPLNFRGGWGASRQDLNNPHFIAMVETDQNFLDSGYDDLIAPSARSALSCRIIATIFTILLVLRHALPIILGGADGYTIATLAVVMILIPVYVMLRALAAFQRRRQHQDVSNVPSSTSQVQNNEHLHVIRIN